MSAYYFHLAFELYHQIASEQKGTTFRPSPSQDLFTSLPHSRVHSYSSAQVQPRSHRRTKSSAAGDLLQLKNWAGERSADKPNDRALDDSDTNSARFQEETNKAPTGGTAQRDWRFDTIMIESIDINQDMSATKPRDPSTQETLPKSSLESSDIALKAVYVPSQPKTTDIGWGVVHLYRDALRSPELSSNNPYGSERPETKATDVDKDKAYIDESCTTLCILAVPSYMTPSDLLGWLGDDTRDVVTHLRLVRTSRSNRYMVLMKFRKAVRQNHGRKSGMESYSAAWR